MRYAHLTISDRDTLNELVAEGLVETGVGQPYEPPLISTLIMLPTIIVFTVMLAAIFYCFFANAITKDRKHSRCTHSHFVPS